MGKNDQKCRPVQKLVRRSSIQDTVVKKTELKLKPKSDLETITAKQKTNSSSNHSKIPISLQQDLLNLFQIAFSTIIESCELKKVFQEIKDALYHRDFKRAFDTPQYLEAYSIRWSPSRALCYQSILVDIINYLDNFHFRSDLSNSSRDSTSKVLPYEDASFEVVCFGGGAAELVAFSGYFRYIKNDFDEKKGIPRKSLESSLAQSNFLACDSMLKISLVDCARWNNVIQKLSDTLIIPSTASKKFDATDTRSSRHLSLMPSDIDIKFVQEDILNMNHDQITNLIGKKPILVTFFFTLNELYTTSVSNTTTFLYKMADSLKKDSLLLVIDSPGSYSETTIGSNNKKYPIHWLLDYCLLSKPIKTSNDTSNRWIKLITEESKWFRIPEALHYPVKLENMRYQIHLYRRI